MGSNFKFEHFEKLWKKANDEQKSNLFYFSLFDFKSFEEEARIKIINYIRNVEKELKDLIKVLDKHFFNKIERDGFIKVVSNDKFLRYIILYELKSKKIRIKWKNRGFPDLLIEEDIEFEIKRLTSTKNLEEYLENIDSKRCEKLFLLLLFPQIDEEDNLDRLKELTNGYYFIKKKIPKSKDTEMLICYPNKNNLKLVIENIINTLKSPKWYRSSI